MTVRGNAFYGRGSGWIYGYSCRGTETSLSACSVLSYSSLVLCNHYNDVGVDCEGKVFSVCSSL